MKTRQNKNTPERHLKLALFSHTSGLNGAGLSFADLVNGLAYYGCECLVFIPGSGPLLGLLKSKNISTIEVLNHESWNWTTNSDNFLNKISIYKEQLSDLLHDLGPALIDYAPDYVIASTLTSPVGLLLAELCEVPSAISIREYGDTDHGFSFVFSREDSMAAVYDSCSRIFCVTNDIKNYHFQNDEMKKCRVIFSNINIVEEHPTGRIDFINNEISHFVSKQRYLTLLPATFQKGKGQQELIEATLLLLEKGHNLHCLLVGASNDQNYLNMLRSRVNKTKFKDRYLFIDKFIKDIYPIMKIADCVVCCSEQEAFSRTLIEASILGVPIIFNDSGGAREVFDHEVHGLCYRQGSPLELAARIEQNILNPADAESRAQRAKSHCGAKFTRDSYIGPVLAAIYTDLAKPQYRKDNLQTLIFGSQRDLLGPTWELKVIQKTRSGRVLKEEKMDMRLGCFRMIFPVLQNSDSLHLSSSSQLPISLETMSISFKGKAQTESLLSAIELYPSHRIRSFPMSPVSATINLPKVPYSYEVHIHGQIRRARRKELVHALQTKNEELMALRLALAKLFKADVHIFISFIKQRLVNRPLVIWGTGTIAMSLSGHFSRFGLENHKFIDPIAEATEEEDVYTLHQAENLLSKGSRPYIVFATSFFSEGHKLWIPKGYQEIDDYLVVTGHFFDS